MAETTIVKAFHHGIKAKLQVAFITCFWLIDLKVIRHGLKME